MSEYITLDDYQLYVKSITPYKNSADKPVLVFLHDSWGCVDMWGGLPEKMVELTGMNAIVYDRRGYGKSSPFGIKKRTNDYLHDEADILIQLLNKLNIPKAFLYGHSDGATVSLIAAARYPERIVALILEGVHSFVEEYGRASVIKSRERAKTSSLLKGLEKYHGDRTAELFRLWHETWLDPNFASWTIVPLLADIKCPVLSYQGVNDEYGTIRQQTILKENIPANVTIAEIPDAGHTPRKENPEEAMKLIEDFLKHSV